MTTKMRLLCIVALITFALPVFAQQVNDAYQVAYFSQSGIVTVGDTAKLAVINTGQIGSPIDPTTREGTVCADFYVFDTNQEMVECCSCPITANGLLRLSVPLSLLDNPLTGGFAPTRGVIKIVADAGCNEQTITTPVPGGLRAFISNPQFGNGERLDFLGTVEEQFAPVPLQAAERAFLGQACSFVQYLGSGRGLCQCNGGRLQLP